MASKTPFLDLYKKDPVLDKADTFNITTMLNENWDKIDIKVKAIDADKVDKELNKGLSTNDFTTALKDKLAGIESGANKYTHPSTHDPAIIKQDKDNRFISDLELAQIEDNKRDLSSHKTDIVSLEGKHGLRYYNERFEMKIDGEWIEFKSGSQYPVGNVSSFNAKSDDNKITLTWQDPPNVTIDDSLGNKIDIAKWKGTKILRKIGSYPQNENDGVLAIDNGVRDQYQNKGFKDTGLVNDTKYFYMAFPYTEDDVFTVDEVNRVSATPSEWHDTTGSPGSAKLLAGTIDQGYFGIVPSSELWTGTQLSSAVGISEGFIQFDDTSWLKFILDGKILFRPMKALRSHISWDAIDNAGCVFGAKTVTKNGHTYKVRLMKGANKDPANGFDGDICHYSEWNKLMLPIHILASTGNWKHPKNVESDVSNWNIGFNNTDLDVGMYAWCQEVAEKPDLRLLRSQQGISFSYSGSPTLKYNQYGWFPVLELVS